MSGYLRINLSQIKPWSYLNDKFNWEGILCSIIEYVSKSLNITYILNEKNWDSIINELQNNILYLFEKL